MELSATRQGDRSCDQYYVLYFRVALVQGKFPDYLLEVWDDYDFRKNSDNDRPGAFGRQQGHLVSRH